MPFVGYGVYKLLARRTSLTSPRRALAAGVGAYVGINAAALCAAIEFGIQPDLFYKTAPTAATIPLYAPFHLVADDPGDAAAPTSLVAGVVELVLTVGVIAYLQRANLPILRINHDAVPELDAELAAAAPARPAVGVHRARRRWSLLVPLGLLATRRRVRRGRPERPRPGASTASAPCRPGWRSTATSGATRCFPGYDFKSGGNPLRLLRVGRRRDRLIVGVVIIGVRVAACAALPAATAAPTSNATAGGRHRVSSTAGRPSADAGLAGAGRGRAVPVRLHRQAAEGQLRREDPRLAQPRCSARLSSPRTSPPSPVCSSGSTRGSSSHAARSAPGHRVRAHRRRAPRHVRRDARARAASAISLGSSSSGSGCSSRSSRASSCSRPR